MGELDTALEAVEDLLEMGFRDFVTLEASPYFAELRNDSRFQDLIDRYQD